MLNLFAYISYLSAQILSSLRARTAIYILNISSSFQHTALHIVVLNKYLENE